MSAQPEGGVHLSSRVSYILVLLSICINIFFLLIGILIGRGDLEWSKNQDALPVTEVTDEGEIPNPLDQELANFEDAEMPDLEAGSRAARSVQEPEATPELAPIEVARPAETLTSKPQPPPAKPRPEPEKPKPESATQLGSGYWIQVSASRDRSAANTFLAKIEKGGYKGAILSEGGYFKVQAGPYPSRRAAETDLTLLNRRYGVKGWIRTR